VSSSSDAEEEAEERRKRKREKEKEKLKEQEEEDMKNENANEMSNFEVEERKKFFFKSIKTKNWGKIIGSIIVGAIFTAYFIQIYVYHNYFESQLFELRRVIPIFFDRFRYLILSYAFLRERIINNNTLSSFETDPLYGSDLDVLYNDYSMLVEKQLTDFKVSSASVSMGIVELLKVMDSESFCNKIIGDRSSDVQNSTSDRYPTPTYVPGFKPYQEYIASIVAAERAISTGNVQSLKRLHESGVDLRQLNYDNRNLIHIAAKLG
jgi:hypothetical protein